MAAVEAISSWSHAAEGLYERHADRIFGFCVNRLGTRQEAEDAMQTTFLCALRALQRGVVPVSETAWLFKIAENVCRSAHRSSGRRQEVTQGPEIVEAQPARAPDADDLFGVGDALALIPESQRRAIILREWQGLSYREISRELDLTPAAVESLIFRARRSLVRALNGGAGLKPRVAGVVDLGTLLSALKSMLGGATAVKLAAGAAVLAVATLPAGDSSKAAISPNGSAHARTGRPAPATAGLQRSLHAGPVAARRVIPDVGRRGHSAGSAPRSGPARKSSHPGRVVPADGRGHGSGEQASAGATQAEPPAASSAPSLRLPPPAPPVDPPVSLPTLPSVPVEPPRVPELPNLPVELPALPSLPELP